MTHYNKETDEEFTANEFLEERGIAMITVANVNGGNNTTLEHAETTANKIFNGYTGVYEKFRIVDEENLIGYLEIFKCNDNSYFNIFTSPVNNR